MTAAPVSTAIESDLIQEEIAAARLALDRYYDLSAAEYRQQKERLASIEGRVAELEKATESLRLEVESMMQSRIWRTLVKSARFVERIFGARAASGYHG